MRTESLAHRVQALIDVPLGQTATIRQILFEGVRAECARIGVQEGQVIRAGGRTDSHLLLESGDGCATTIGRHWARFIEVEPTFGPSI